MMFLNSDEDYYAAVVRELEAEPSLSYPEVIGALQARNIIGEATPDGVSWTDPALDLDELTEAICEFVE
jgi:hypothetical protein